VLDLLLVLHLARFDGVYDEMLALVCQCVSQ
jgi:hypothetical protein